jgi:hypothetical protein
MRSVIPPLLLLAVSGMAADQRPVKLDIQAEWYGVRAGEQVPIRIGLLSATNQPAQAPKRFDVQLQARLPSGEVKPLRTVTLEQGESTKEVSIAPPGFGMIYIWAKQPELLPGGVYLAVRTSGSTVAQSSPRTPTMSRSPTLPQQPAVEARPAPAPNLTGAPPRPQTPGPHAIPKMALRYSPDRRFLADGKDAATVQAFLLGEFTATDIQLNLFDSSGTMKPIPLTILKGRDSGRSALTFNQPGTVTVEFMGSEPPAELDGDKKLEIPFMPAITHVRLEASPPVISLADKADLLLTFRDEQERPVAIDVARPVTFVIETGRGELAQEEVDVGAGQFEARTTFQPAWLGRAEISATSPNLLTVSIPLQVSMPTGLLLCSLGGGLVGGYFSYSKRKRSGRRQIGIGIVTGFLFYWACLFLGLGAIGHAVVINPLSAFALSTFGGWMQTGVFAFWKSRLKAP